MSKFIFTLSLVAMIFCKAQENNSHALYAKGNAVFLPLGMINLGLEYQLSEKYTIQADGFISPWKSFLGRHSQVYMGHLEGRYYFDKAFTHWYLGVNAGFGLFDLTKWNYSGTTKFQRGFNYMLGATVGYQMEWKKNWNIDFYIGLGSVQSFYHGYEKVPPSFVRYDGAEGWNRSGEFLPYRGGIMISYKIK